ncbi:hypothetical protein B0T24DRAFT_362230 [Lasiosphaeria ovina]|uniref:Fucose-specific lectin n=1 Tax=Lasiosphaeria ovina TaxID=92902 RepID=A0AAE0K5A0_9PEZI|nr:hypothetical protein B0T24DRAFT_362230 [Lasiosphaeria ovina]
MAPISALLNEGVESTEKAIHVFFVTDQKNLGVSLRNSGQKGKDTQDFYAADKNTWEGIILAKSEIGTARVDGVNLVVAMTRQKPSKPDAADTMNDISIVSPVYQVLTSTALKNTTATICSAGDRGWVYYLSGTESGKVDIKEYDLGTGNISTFGGLNVYVDCSLGAFYDPISHHRCIIFQEMSQGHLKEYNVDTKQTIDISDTSGAKPNTSLCVTYHKDAAYLYYTDSFFNIYRVIKRQNNWGAHKQMFNDKPDEFSQMTAVTANGVNHIFFQVAGNANITHLRDDEPSTGPAA